MIVTNSQRLLGIGLLVLVNVVWVLSSELTRYLFIDLAFARPFFFTYAKSCLLSLLLLRYSCNCCTEEADASKKDGTEDTAGGGDGGGGGHHNDANDDEDDGMASGSSSRNGVSNRKSKKKRTTTSSSSSGGGTAKTTKSGTAVYTQLENIGMGSDGEEEEEVEMEERGDQQGQTDEAEKRRRNGRTMTAYNANDDDGEHSAMNNTNNIISPCSSSSSSTITIEGRTTSDDGVRRHGTAGGGSAVNSSEQSYEAPKLTSVEFEHFQLPSSASTAESELCSDDEALLQRDPVELDAMKRELFDALVDKKAHQQQRKRVRFSCIRQVRALPEKVELDARLARLPYHRHVARRLQHCPNCPALNRDSALFSYAIIFAPLWMISSVAFQTSLAFASVTTVNLFTASCPLFVLILGAFFGKNSSDAFTGTKLALVLLNLSGVCVVSRVSGSLLGSAIAMLSAVANALYLFALSRFAAKAQRQIDAVLLLGIVGLFSLVVCTPLMFTVHNLGIERQLPLPTVRQFVVLVLNAAIGTLFADSLWLYATLLTGGLTSALSGSLGIPLSMLADSYFRNQPPSAWQVLSSIPIMISFLGASLITMPRHHRTSSSHHYHHHQHQKAKCSPPVSASSSSEDATASSAPFDIVGMDIDQQQHLRLITSSSSSSSSSSSAGPSFVSDSPSNVRL
ncbi:hypothetical protein niasHT_023546 [Heterodera trifolii]|uniref:EamA domain-containing protein n=1 Tax=Heterodera trifolii TaxID=157864 RepID=A0ABD2JES4_9BILA